MRLRVEKAPLRRILRLGQWALGAGAVAMLGYGGLLWADGWYFQKAERQRFEAMLSERPKVPRAGTERVAVGGLMGRIEIPRLGVSVMIAEGVDQRTLRRAAGHIPGTGQPGQAGNVGISAHRDTFFRPLRNIRKDDVITLATAMSDYEYRVVSTRITTPSDVSVLEPDGKEILTLVTCYPFYFVGSAPNRFIVRAERVTLH
jgi:sortase A